MSARLPNPPVVFISYAREDEEHKKELVKQLDVLKKQGVISHWHDALLVAGEQWDDTIARQIDASHIILLLISPDFLNSEYIENVEMKRASVRHNGTDVVVVPVLVRPVNSWEHVSFGKLTLGKLNALPDKAKFIVNWDKRDDAFTNVAAGIQKVAGKLKEAAETEVNGAARSTALPRPPAVGFVARHDKEGRDIVEYMMRLLKPSDKRLITLWGAGAVGKSTLAVEIARKWAEVYGRPVVWSNAEKKTDYTLRSLLKDIIVGLRQPDDAHSFHRGSKKERAYALVAEAQPLILLDTYERIAPDARRKIMKWFERAQCVALFTSREEVPNTLNITLDPMSLAEAQELIKLLTEHSKDEDKFDPETCRRIHKVTGGRPYPIAWVVHEITTGGVPNKVFKELRRGEGDVGERVFHRYFDLPEIGDDGRAVLLALSLFAPHATADALAAVAGFPGDEARLRKVIRNLSKQMLIKCDDCNEHFSLEGLPLTMAAARLPKSRDAAGIWRRFVTYFRDYALDPKNHWATPEDEDHPKEEKSNIFRAIRVAPCINDWDAVVELYDSWVDFMHVSRKEWKRAIWLAEEYAEQNIKLKDHLTPLMIEIYHRNKEEIRTRYETIGKKLEEENPSKDKEKPWKKVVLSGVKFELGVFAYHEADYPLARRLLVEAQTLQEEIKHTFGVGMTCNNLGVVLAMQGKRAEAEIKFRKALDIFTTEIPKPDALKVRDRHGVSLCNFEGFRPYEKRGSRFSKKGERFAEAVRLNLKWLERLRAGG